MIGTCLKCGAQVPESAHDDTLYLTATEIAADDARDREIATRSGLEPEQFVRQYHQQNCARGHHILPAVLFNSPLVQLCRAQFGNTFVDKALNGR